MSTLRYKLAALRGQSMRFSRPTRKTILLGVGVLLVVGLLGSRVLNQPDEVAETVPTPTVALIAVADHRTNTGIVQATGEVASIDEVTLKSEVSVPVQDVFVEIGASVVAGQPLLAFDTTDLNAQLAQADAGVAQATATLTLLQVGAREEEKERARLAVSVAEQGLWQAIAARDQVRINNESTLTSLQQTLDQSYASSVQSAQSLLATTTDSLLVVADLQQTYFNCSSHTVCRSIATEKQDAMQSLFAVPDGGQWNTQTILKQKTGLAPRLAILQKSAYVDPAELHLVLTDLDRGMRSTRRALQKTREGLETFVAADATATDRATVDASRVALDVAISTLQAKQQALEIAEGGTFYGGEAKSISDTRARNEASLRAADAAVQTADLSVASAKQTRAATEFGPRAVDLTPAQAALSSAYASYTALLAQQRRYLIVAPFNGVVASLPARRGELLGAGQVMVSIVNPDVLEMTAWISAQDRVRMQSGARVRINGTANGVVTFIAPGINRSTGKVEVRIAVEQTSPTLTIGQLLPIEVESAVSASDTTYQLPLPAVRIQPSGSVVYRVQDGRIVEQRVQTGTIFGERVEITSGLAPTDTIVASTRGLHVGDLVLVP